MNRTLPVYAENLYIAACNGDADKVVSLLQSHEIPQAVRDIAHEIAVAGGYTEVAQAIRPVVH